MGDFTEYCVSLLRECLRSECTEFKWDYIELTIKGGDIDTRVDISGTKEGRSVLVQFEMHREGVSTNAIKAAYCLERDPNFKEQQILVLHVFSPFCEKPTEELSKQSQTETDDEDFPKEFQKFRRKKERRLSGRRNAYTHKKLCLFWKEKGVLDSETRRYEMIEWNLDDFPEVREATIVLPTKGPFPVNTREAIEILAKSLGKAIELWQKG